VSQANACAEQRLVAAPLILVIDDDSAVRRVLELHLRRFGYRVAVAEGGPEGLALYRELGSEVALVLLDVHMPAMSGPATLAALRQIDPVVRCWFMSGFPAGILPARSPSDHPQHQGHEMDLRVGEVLNKPFHMAHLEALLRSALGCPPGRA
jgi:CheY-like chemotaxis protein